LTTLKRNSDTILLEFNHWESVILFINGLGYLDFIHVYYFGVFKSTKDIPGSTSRVLNSLVSMYIKGKTFCQQLSFFNMELNMPMYVITQLVIERFKNAVIK
jgi:hypothetical protein